MSVSVKTVTRPGAPETFPAHSDAMRESGVVVSGAFESLGLQLQNAVSFVLFRWRVAGKWSSGAGSHWVTVLGISAVQGGKVQPEFKIRKK
jgi:hypothetical protein